MSEDRHQHQHKHKHEHDHGQGQGQGQGHGHNHGLGHHQAIQGRIGFAFFSNLAFAIIELIGGIYVNSVAILSDALHDFGDAVALGVAWYLEGKSRNLSDQEYSYGYKRLSTLSAVVSAMVLISGSLIILWESVPRLLRPETPNFNGMIGLSILGIAVNGVSYLRMKKGSSLNERVLTWHFIEDLMGWVIVFIGAIVMKIFNIPVIDALMAVALACWVMWNVVKTLKEAFRIFLQAIPHHYSLAEIGKIISGFEGVVGIHHSHMWTLDGEVHIYTSHIVVNQQFSVRNIYELKIKIKSELRKQFNISEATLEFEWSGEECLDPHHH